MKTSKTRIILLGSALSSAGALWYVSLRAPEPAQAAVTTGLTDEQASAAPARSFVPSATNTRAPSTLLAVREAAAPSSPSVSAEAAASTGPSVQVTPSTQSPSAADLDDYHTRQADLLNLSVDGGQRDAWAQQTRVELTDGLRSMLENAPNLGVLDDVECSAALCRARLTPGPSDDPSVLLNAIRGTMNWPGERYFQLIPHDPPQLTIFAARDGLQLPRTTPPTADRTP